MLTLLQLAILLRLLLLLVFQQKTCLSTPSHCHAIALVTSLFYFLLTQCLPGQFWQAGRPAHMAVPSQLLLFHSGQQVLIGPNGFHYPALYFTICHTVFVWDAEYSVKASNLQGFHSMLQLQCEHPCLTCRRRSRRLIYTSFSHIFVLTEMFFSKFLSVFPLHA